MIRYKVCAIVGDFDNRKKGLTHYIFENIDKSIFDIFYICYPSRDFELWTNLYNKNFEIYGFKTYLVPRYNLLKRIFTINRILDYEKPDIIFSAVTGTEPFIMGKIRNIPIVNSIHSIQPNFNLSCLLRGKLKGTGLRSIFLNKFRNFSNHVIAVSEAVSTNLINNGINKEKIKVIYNGIDIKYIKKESSVKIDESHIFHTANKIISSVGRLSPEKGHKYLIEAFNLIKSQTDSKLVIIGWGPEEKHLRNLIKIHSIEHRVFFLGFKENPFKYMKRSTIFVHPSISEAFPSVLLEAAACGLPVIATDCGGTKEILAILRHGILIPSANPETLGKAMLNLLNNTTLLKNFSKNAFTNVNKFHIKKTAHEYQQLWLKSLNDD